MSQHDVHAMGRQALSELGTVFDALDADAAETLCDAIMNAGRIACHSVGREGLMMRALCMRLFHLGFDAHVVGDMTTPPLGDGDLLLVSVGPGKLPTVQTFMQVAKDAGATTLVVTAQPDGETSKAADVVVHLPAQTMADDTGEGVALLPMGSLFEAAELLFFDLVSIMLRDKTQQSAEAMRARHTNLE